MIHKNRYKNKENSLLLQYDSALKQLAYSGWPQWTDNKSYWLEEEEEVEMVELKDCE